MDDTTNTPKQERDIRTGQYAETKFEAMCVCGHNLGVHAAVKVDGMRPCFNGDCGDGASCDCEKFRKSKKVAK